MTPEERFWEKVDRDGGIPPHVDGVGQCWTWTGARNPRGYGHLTLNKVSVVAHRQSWEWAFGPIPDGMRVLHACDNPPCVRPSHLFLGTQADNIADMIAKGRSAQGTAQARRTHCPRGHAYDEANTYRNSNKRECRACNRLKARRRYAARKIQDVRTP